MNILDIIAKKRDGLELTEEEISYFIQSYVTGDVTDYQAAALVMAIYIRGMNKKETAYLTNAMAYSGKVLDLSAIGEVVDKHSTGGVGDKVTLILMPLIASLGIPVAKMSGRGLGFTGGTADKLEAIPGYCTNIEVPQLIDNVKKVGISLVSQTLELAPADKKLYALRDAISCTESIPLIASSIMSKKIAAGSNKIILDVTCGSGAFMKDWKEAKELAIAMKGIGMLVGKATVCVITQMDQPLGRYVGNNLEVIEATEALKGNWEPDVKKVVLTLGAYLLQLAGKGNDIEENKQKLLEKIQEGKAYEKWLELVQNQGGDTSYIRDTSKFEKANYTTSVLAKQDGYLAKVDAYTIGNFVCDLGAGRKKKEDTIDPTVGIACYKKVGDKVSKQEIIAEVYSKEPLTNLQLEQIQNAYAIVNQKVEPLEEILEVI